MANIQQTYHDRVVVLQNLLDRIIPLRGAGGKSFSLRGTITLAERNAIVIALQEMAAKSFSLRLRSAEEGRE